MTDKYLTGMFEFIDKSPVCFYAVKNAADELEKAGFSRLLEGEHWELTPGGKYFVTRNSSSLIAFKLPECEPTGINMISAHTDSPCFKVKENPELEAQGHYTRLSVEGYGGMLMAPWFDRPLSVAGRAYVRTEGGMQERLVNIDRDILEFPSLAIHMDRNANSGHEYKKNVDMVPLFSGEKAKLSDLVADALGVGAEDIISTDLFVYNRDRCHIWGAHDEFMSGPRLDDLMCAYAGLKAITEADDGDAVQLLALFDNEEVGSLTRQGACSTFLSDTLRRICADAEKYHQLLANSINVSADNAHAVHPNFPELTDPCNRCYLNSGLVIKKNASQKYATDAYARALFIRACDEAGAVYQNFENRPDMAGGSTLGNLLNYNVSIPTVDVGLPQLAMHSPLETAGTQDLAHMVKAMKQALKMRIKVEKCGINVDF